MHGYMIVRKFKTPRSGVQAGNYYGENACDLGVQVAILTGLTHMPQSPARLYGLTRWGDSEVCSPGRSMVNVR